MPTSSKTGKYHMNPAHMKFDDGRTGKNPLVAHPAVREPEEKPMAESGGAHTTLHDHGDGTYHTEGHDGERVEHPHIGHALMHLAAKHGPEGKHMHVHSHEVGHTTHHVHEDGEIQGPHEHPDIESLKDHLDETIGDGGGERVAEAAEESAPTGHSLHGM